MKHISILLVVLLVLASANPCAALTTDGSGGVPAPGQREPRALPAVAIGGYVVTNAELIALLVGVVGGVVGYVTVAVDKHGVGDVIDHWNEFQEKIPDFFHGGAGGLLQFRTHDVHVYEPNIPGFSLVEQRYNTAKAVQDSYEDSKRKGIPVPGNNKGEVRHDVDRDWKIPLSSFQLFRNEVDKRNGCPKQIRYYNEKGEWDMDIDFYHDLSSKSTVTFPHKHFWRNGVRDESHIYEGIDEIIQNWRCKDYDFKNSKWRW